MSSVTILLRRGALSQAFGPRSKNDIACTEGNQTSVDELLRLGADVHADNLFPGLEFRIHQACLEIDDIRVFWTRRDCRQAQLPDEVQVLHTHQTRGLQARHEYRARSPQGNQIAGVVHD
jgi:hypothetical protein